MMSLLLSTRPSPAALRRGLSRLSSEPDFLRQCRSHFRIVGRDKRIGRGKSPSLPVLLRRHLMIDAEMSLEHRETLAATKAQEVIREYRLLHGYRWVGRRRWSGRLTSIRQRPMDVVYQLRKLVRRHGIIGHMRRHNLGSKVQHGTSSVSHGQVSFVNPNISVTYSPRRCISSFSILVFIPWFWQPEYRKGIPEAFELTHAERLVHKLDAFTDLNRAAQQHVRKLIWNFYADLKAYRAKPSQSRRLALRTRFDRIFQRRTGFTTLDRLLSRLHANKAELLTVLDRPRRRYIPTAPRTISAARSLGGRSAPEPAATLAAIAVMHSSASARPAPSSAWSSGTFSAVSSMFSVSASFRPCPDSSTAAASPPDPGACPGFCPRYQNFFSPPQNLFTKEASQLIM